MIPNAPGYWDEVEAAWVERPDRPAPHRLGRVRGGAIAAAVMLGIQEALEPDGRDRIVIEVDVDRPERPVGRVLLHFDPASPRRTVAVVPPA